MYHKQEENKVMVRSRITIKMTSITLDREKIVTSARVSFFRQHKKRRWHKQKGDGKNTSKKKIGSLPK